MKLLPLLAVTVALLLASQSSAFDGLPPLDARAAPLVSVLVGQPAEPAEPIPPPVATPQGTRDEELIGQVLRRPQPTQAPARPIDTGEALLHVPGMGRLWGPTESWWEAPAFCHRPLYFEDENLERHGRSFGLAQPAVSAAHFAGRGLAWPYLAGAFPPHECIYTLGRDRSGSWASYRLYRPPVSLKGAAYQAAAVTGLSFVVP